MTRGLDRLRASRGLRLVAIGLAVVVAAAAIGAASRPHSVDLSLSTPELGEVAVLAAVVLAAALGLLYGAKIESLLVMPAVPTSQGESSRVPRAVRILLTLVTLMVIAFLLAASRVLSQHAAQSQQAGYQPPFSASPDASGGSDAVIACLAVALVGFFVAVVLFRSRPPAARLETPHTESVVAILDEGLDALLAERDPRKAVISAYVAMERAMARRGWARRPHEAPTEYLTRVLNVAPSRARDLDGLVNLYEFARFSEHTVTAAMREDAVGSVRRLRAELEEPA